MTAKQNRDMLDVGVLVVLLLLVDGALVLDVVTAIAVLLLDTTVVASVVNATAALLLVGRAVVVSVVAAATVLVFTDVVLEGARVAARVGTSDAICGMNLCRSLLHGSLAPSRVMPGCVNGVASHGLRVLAGTPLAVGDLTASGRGMSHGGRPSLEPPAAA